MKKGHRFPGGHIILYKDDVQFLQRSNDLKLRKKKKQNTSQSFYEARFVLLLLRYFKWKYIYVCTWRDEGGG